MTKQELLEQYDALEDVIEDAAQDQTWALADWLAANVPNEGRGGDRRSEDFKVPRVTLKDLADRRGRSMGWLQRMRHVAEVTAKDRINGVSVRVYEEALINASWDLAIANEAIRSQGSRLRDHAGRMESVTAIQGQLERRTPDEQARVITEALGRLPDEQLSTVADATLDLMRSQSTSTPRRSTDPLPQHHGWEPTMLLGRAVVAAWHAWSRMQDETPPTDELRDHSIALADKLDGYARAMAATLRGQEAPFSDEELAAWVREGVER